MQWDPSLRPAVLKKRYKRFLADVEIGNDSLTVHVPNTGRMTSCWESGWTCALSKSSNPSRKLTWTLELTHNGESWIGVNTANANKLAAEWITNGLIPELIGYGHLIAEKKIRDSRIDFFLEDHPTLADAFVEVKSVTLKLNGRAQFPDTVSERGQKHLEELMKLKSEGYRTVMLYIVQREDVHLLTPAYGIDKRYGELLRKAHALGVEILAYQGKLSLTEITFGKAIPFQLD